MQITPVQVDSSYRGHRSSRGAASYGVSRRTDYRVIASGLPNSCSWQDLKDHMRKGGEVTFAQVCYYSRYKTIFGYSVYHAWTALKFLYPKDWASEKRFLLPYDDSTKPLVYVILKRWPIEQILNKFFGIWKISTGLCNKLILLSRSCETVMA